MTMFRTLFTLSAVALFSMALVGCRAEGEIGDDNTATRVEDRDSSYKKTTTVEPDGDRKVTIEEKR
jgi:hypothetical protein